MLFTVDLLFLGSVFVRVFCEDCLIVRSVFFLFKMLCEECSFKLGKLNMCDKVEGEGMCWYRKREE